MAARRVAARGREIEVARCHRLHRRDTAQARVEAESVWGETNLWMRLRKTRGAPETDSEAGNRPRLPLFFPLKFPRTRI